MKIEENVETAPFPTKKWRKQFSSASLQVLRKVGM